MWYYIRFSSIVVWYYIGSYNYIRFSSIVVWYYTGSYNYIRFSSIVVWYYNGSYSFSLMIWYGLPILYWSSSLVALLGSLIWFWGWDRLVWVA